MGAKPTSPQYQARYWGCRRETASAGHLCAGRGRSQPGECGQIRAGPTMRGFPSTTWVKPLMNAGRSRPRRVLSCLRVRSSTRERRDQFCARALAGKHCRVRLFAPSKQKRGPDPRRAKVGGAGSATVILAAGLCWGRTLKLGRDRLNSGRSIARPDVCSRPGAGRAPVRRRLGRRALRPAAAQSMSVRAITGVCQATTAKARVTRRRSKRFQKPRLSSSF